MVIRGRSDTTLNPAGVRLGTAEIYASLEPIPEIEDSICIAQEWHDDVRVVLFVQLTDSRKLDDGLRVRIGQAIRDATTASHVPAKIIQVADVPRTRSGKLSEAAVREVVHGRPVKNAEALANPAALAGYTKLAELRD
jgi:acetoacetyl-CoA synthetase